MDFEDQQEEEQEQEMSMETSLGGGGGGGLTTTTITTTKLTNSRAKYRECLKNHAVGIGGHSLDGCGEFMPAGEEGSIDALKCAACNCHRNFHRKEANSSHYHHHHHHNQQFSPLYYRPSHPQQPPAGYFHLTPPPNHRQLGLPASVSGGGGVYSREDEDVSNPSSSGGGGGGSGGSKKRLRTKFTQKQKDKMLDFAVRIGWRLQRHDDVIIEHFCNETGINRRVLKVWLHNNKHTLGKKP